MLLQACIILLNTILLYEYIPLFLSILLSVDIFFMLQLFTIRDKPALNTFVCKFWGILISFILDKSSQVKTTSSQERCNFNYIRNMQILDENCSCSTSMKHLALVFSVLSILLNTQQCLIVILICISLISKAVESLVCEFPLVLIVSSNLLSSFIFYWPVTFIIQY